jgi:hypothetical protein
MSNLVTFRYNIVDREFCISEKEVVINSKTVIIIGERNGWRIYDGHKKGFVVVNKAFFVNYNGVEYGTEDLSQESLFNNTCCNRPSDPFQYFEIQFEKQFE